MSAERIYTVGLAADSAPLSVEQVGEIIDCVDSMGSFFGASVSAGPNARGVSCTASLRATSFPDACALAVESFEKAMFNLGVSFELGQADVMTDEFLEAELAHPDDTAILAGVREIAEMLKVSPQRVSELRHRPDFPAPVAELAAGPVWRVSSLRRFIQEWPRRPGRPAKVS